MHLPARHSREERQRDAGDRKVPEYDRIWADNVLRAIVVFGTFEDGATTSSDAGISAYNAFVGMMNTELAASSLVTVPATIPSHPARRAGQRLSPGRCRTLDGSE